MPFLTPRDAFGRCSVAANERAGASKFHWRLGIANVWLHGARLVPGRKFGIWAHWGAASVPAAGDDWYARDMYLQGHPSYQHHLKHYGHPADRGFMKSKTRGRRSAGTRRNYSTSTSAQARVTSWRWRTIMTIWTASPHPTMDGIPHASVRRGISSAHGGVSSGTRPALCGSNHSAHAWHWNQPAYGYDPEGPRRGQRYDAARLSLANGRGTWWNGLDPQHLYGGASMQMPDGIGSLAEANAWHAATDGLWNEGLRLIRLSSAVGYFDAAN